MGLEKSTFESLFRETKEEVLIEVAQRALMKNWFPKNQNEPRDEDDKLKWEEIAYREAVWVIDAIKECGVIFVYPNQEGSHEGN